MFFVVVFSKGEECMDLLSGGVVRYAPVLPLLVEILLARKVLELWVISNMADGLRSLLASNFVFLPEKKSRGGV